MKSKQNKTQEIKSMLYGFNYNFCLNCIDVSYHQVINDKSNWTINHIEYQTSYLCDNKANLRDLIAATGLVISNWIQIVNFSPRVTVKFDGWPRKTIGHLFYTTSNFVRHLKSIGEFKLDLQSRNAQFGSQLVICYPLWPWNLMDNLG